MNTPLVLAALLAALAAAPPVHAEPYTGPMAMSNCAGGLHASSTCVKVPAGATSVTPFVTDAAFGAEAGQIQL